MTVALHVGLLRVSQPRFTFGFDLRRCDRGELTGREPSLGKGSREGRCLSEPPHSKGAA
jgi:hypothetical protein